MKKLRTLFLLCAFSVVGFAQQPFGYHATWYFSFSEFGYNGFKKVEHIGDTVMHNMTWLKFSVTGTSEIQTGPNQSSIDSNSTWDNIYFATRNDSVFRMNNGQPDLLFDFSAGNGDSWQFITADTAFSCADSSVATVQAIRTKTFGSTQLSYYSIRNPMDSINIGGTIYYQPSSAFTLDSMIFQSVGCLSYSQLFSPFPNTCNGTSFQAARHSLRCYTDDNISINRSNQACDYWSGLSLTENSNTRFTVFPNPSNGTLHILNSSNESGRLQIFDHVGRLHQEHEIRDRQELTISLPLPGLYFVHFTTYNGEHSTEKIIIQ